MRLCVSHAKIEMSVFVLDAVTGKIEDEEVVLFRLAEKPRNRPANDGQPLVWKLHDLVELADFRSPQHSSELAYIHIGRREPGESGIVIAAVADDESDFAAHTTVNAPSVLAGEGRVLDCCLGK